MKILTIIGARPQFIKAAVVSKEISETDDISEIIVHTGQHFDNNMSNVFFEQMKISKPKYNLGINKLGHGAMTGRMLEQIEEILIKEKPDIVMVYGDTNSTIAGALAAKKLHVNLAHVEAGLRSFNMKMPEEINRILTDRISDYLFCPSDTAISNLSNEGFDNYNCSVIKTGDVMFDAIKVFKSFSKKPNFDIPDEFILTTIHRAENTDNKENLRSIINSLNKISHKIPIVLPIHPRTRQIIKNLKINDFNNNVFIIDPVGYFEMLFLLEKTIMVMTDSGGLQKEAFFFKKPCITLRDETEWTELVDAGVNIITGANRESIIHSYDILLNKENDFSGCFYGSGNARKIIVKQLINPNQ